MLQHVFDADFALADPLRQSENAHQTALIGDGFDLVVRQVARVVEHAAGVGVTDEKRCGGHFQGLEEPLAIHVREIYDHAQSIRFFDDFDAEISQTAACAVFPDAVTELIAKIPNWLQRAQPEAVEVS